MCPCYYAFEPFLLIYCYCERDYYYYYQFLNLS